MSIIIDGLSKTYTKDSLVLDNINLEIKEGSVFGLLGPNGAGKSTLVSILNNIIKKDSGTISFFGKDFDTNTQYVKKHSSFVPQTYAFYPDLTTKENLEFFGSLYGLSGNELQKKIAFCVEVTSLQKYLNKRAQTYSGGVKRRLNIAIGLLNSPKVIYLDEPTTGVDPQARNYILEMIKEINQEINMTVVYTSHYMEEIEYLCDDIAILDNQKIIYHNSKEEMLRETKKVNIELNSGALETIDIVNDYNSMIEYLHENKNNIKHIDLQHKSLEEMFLKLTQKELRD